MKRAKLLREIKGIYRQHSYRRRGRPLSDFGDEQLAKHLGALRAGRYPWITGPKHRQDAGATGEK